MTVVLHMSDPHFGTEQAPVVEALARLAQAQSPDLVILSGDITQRATHRQFDAAKTFLARLDAPATLVIPGNHDIPLFDLAARLFAPYARYRRAFGPELEPVHDGARLLAVGVNTTRRYRRVDGEISRAQIERVAARLERASPSQLRIVVTHQPVYVTHTEDEKNLLHGRDDAIRQWAAAGVDLILGGHIHRPFACKLPERLTGVARPVWLIQAGTALSWRIRHDAGNSVNLIRTRAGMSQRRCSIERWDFVESSQEFMLVDSQESIE
ncbi:metallophosphoesterase family protein [soil metagenome]